MRLPSRGSLRGRDALGGFPRRMRCSLAALQIKDISESRAVNLGAEILGEGIVMSVAAVAVFGEYRSRKYKEAQVAAEKDARRKERLQARQLLSRGRLAR